ncbi:unnamed protein product, partial [Thlaspi arvense]
KIFEYYQYVHSSAKLAELLIDYGIYKLAFHNKRWFALCSGAVGDEMETDLVISKSEKLAVIARLKSAMGGAARKASNIIYFFPLFWCFTIPYDIYIVKLLDGGEDGMMTTAETAALRASFRQEVAFIGTSMGTSNLKIPLKNRTDTTILPLRMCCIVVEYLSRGTLKKFLYANRKKKLAFQIELSAIINDCTLNLKIADFGVAHAKARNPQDMTRKTGTLGYMEPEVLDGKPYNRKCDVYSFGICLWEIYFCHVPYMNLSFVEAKNSRCCSSSLSNIMKKCWNANLEKRSEMNKVVELLEAIDTSKGGGMILEGQGAGCFYLALT